ncbi:sulfurtransferase [Haloarchaeobius sp. FL176]|uniref:sulfurtransferase n=1 Tax=Haloarchaeobius sp. FL176 TaxID=2967129 RepID=UPI002148999D|nr:sulfurtransferase [Haloarchaeobius sp. FL176]
MTDAPRVVSPEWLAEELDTARVVDVRDAWEYEGIGHIPGAVSVPFDSFRDEDSDAPGTLPGVDEWNAVLSAAGVANDDTLVAYDDTHGVFAARFVVTALAYGHADVHLLDGDFSAWRLAHETESGAPEVEPTEYEGQFDEDWPLVDAEDVRAALDTDAVLVDTREDWEYEEGHIPGARLLDWREFVDEETRGLKPEAELRELLESRGITPERRVVLYCNTARRISHTYVVLDHLGYENVSFFEGSLTEWKAIDGPLETA